MIRLTLYLVGVILIAAALYAAWLPFQNQIPAGLMIAAILLVVGLGVVGAAYTVRESRMGGPGTELTETRQQVGDTEVRRSRLE